MAESEGEELEAWPEEVTANTVAITLTVTSLNDVGDSER